MMVTISLHQDEKEHLKGACYMSSLATKDLSVKQYPVLNIKIGYSDVTFFPRDLQELKDLVDQLYDGLDQIRREQEAKP